MNTATVAWRGLRREWQARELRAVFWALLIAVAGVVSVAAFADRLQQAIAAQGSELLGADLVVATPNQPEQNWLREAQRRGLRATVTASFRSVVVAGDKTQLAEVKAVKNGYPLRGTLRITDNMAQPDQATAQLPPPGAVWLDSQLLNALQLRMGESLRLGNATLRADKLITYEPDRGGTVFALAPRLLLNARDLDATGLIAPGSLVRYRLLVAGEPAVVTAYRSWLIANGVSAANLQDLSNAQPRFRASLERGERFLGLATLLGVLLAGLAVARAARYYANRQLDTAAILRCMGARQRDILSIYLWQFVYLSAASSLAGCAIGYLAQQGLAWLLPGLVAGVLPPPGATPIAVGVAIGMAACVGFALPVVLRIRNVPPLRVLRRDLGAIPTRLYGAYLIATLTLALLTAWLARDITLTLWVLGIGAVSLALLSASGYGLVALVARLRGATTAAWRLGLANIARHRGASVAQIVSLGLGVTAILLLTVVRGELFAGWQQRLPADTPNQFLINIQAGQVDALTRFMSERGVPPTRLSPIVRARLLSINGTPVDPERFAEGFARRVVQRAANLSWAATLPEDNTLVSGQWWPTTALSADQPVPLSVEQRYADALRLRPGDLLRYRIDDRELTLRVANSRRVDWDSFRPNFFLLVPPAALADFPASFITSVYVPRERAAVLRELVSRFPNVSNIDVDALLEQVRQLLQRVNLALRYIFLFTIAAGLVVLYTAIQTGHRERQQELAVMRALGARHRQLRGGLLAEYLVLGVMAGLVGALAASVAGWVLALFVFDIPYNFRLDVWLWGVSMSAPVVVLSGWLGTRRLLRLPPWRLVQQTV